MADLNQTVAPLSTIISWFAEDATPTETQFETTWKSFFHKSENIPVEQIYQLAEILNLKAERDHMHFDLAKKDGSNLSVEDINGLKEVLGVALAANGIINNIETTITSEDANVLQDGIYKPKTTGVYAAIGLTAKENYTTLFKKLDGVWSVFSEEKLPAINIDQYFDKESPNPQSGQALKNYGDVIEILQPYFSSDETAISLSWVVGTTSVAGVANTSNSNRTASLNVENLRGKTLRYTGYNFGGLDTILPTYKTIIAETTSGAFVTLEESVETASVSIISTEIKIEDSYVRLIFNIRNENFNTSQPVVVYYDKGEEFKIPIVDQEFDKESPNPQSGQALKNYGDVIEILQPYFSSDETAISLSWVVGTTSVAGVANTSNSNRTASLNVENLRGKTLRYTGYNFGGLVTILPTYKTIIAETTSGAFVTLEESVETASVSIISTEIKIEDSYVRLIFNIRNENFNTSQPVVVYYDKGEEFKIPIVTSVITNDDSVVNNSVLYRKFSGKYLHFSFDDIWLSLKLLTDHADSYSSLWHDRFFSVLKSFHDKYGVCFSLYCFNESDLSGGWDISNVTDKFSDDFKSASSWLKFGFHCKNRTVNYASSSASEIEFDYNYCIQNIVRFTGSYDSVDRIPRLQNFAGNTECITAIRDADCGILGLLAADDNRNSYNLNSSQNNYINTHDSFYDANSFLKYFKTETRLESIVDVEDWFFEYCKNPNLSTEMIVFTHENRLYASTNGGTILTGLKENMEILFFKALEAGYYFDFPQNR